MINWQQVIKFAAHGSPPPERRVEESSQHWAELLTPEQYRITREKGTERAFSGDHCNIYKAGKYACICCDELLFDSQGKFESNSGWPSFTQPIKGNVINYIQDDSHAMTRIEVACSVCDSHLGHVFPDGPPPSGLRFCINSVAIKAVEND